MKDDSLSDVQKYGGYCTKCDTVYDRPHDCVGIREEDIAALDTAYKYESVLSRKIWNEAIEAAALVGEKEWRLTEIGNEIRKLKK